MKETDHEGGGRLTSEMDQSWIPKVIKKRVCSTFVEDSSSNGTLCLCGSGRDTHSSIATGDCFGAAIVSQWNSSQHSSEYPTDAFGEVHFTGASRRHCNFVRLSGFCGGGSGEREGQTLGQRGAETGAGQGSTEHRGVDPDGGLREGIGRCVGEAVRDHSAAASSLSQKKVIAVGVAPWGLVADRQKLVNEKGSFPARYYVQNTSLDSCSLDINYQAFLLVDDGSVGRRGVETAFRAKMEEYISHQRTGLWGSGSIDIPVLCLLIAGEANMLERMDLSLSKNIPWLVLNGSGRAADFICELLDALSSVPLSAPLPSPEGEGSQSLSTELRNRVRERVKKYFTAKSELEKLVDRALSIYQNRDLITVFNSEQETSDEFDTVLLKTLVRANKRVSSDSSEYIEELKLAVAWNRVDIAKSELFNGDIQWKYEDLEDSMTDALINDKPQFVRLFNENGLNILDYLTYQRLEVLYRSLSDSTLVYQLLQRRLSERHALATHHKDAESMTTVSCTTDQDTPLKSPMSGPISAKKLSLYEVFLLIAMFSHTFSKVQENSDTYWKFQRYNLILEYHSRPCLAPPFIILSHLHLLFKRHIRKIPSTKIKHFVLEIHGREASRLNTWEAIQKENIMTAQNKRDREKDSERLKRTSVKVDAVLKQMAEIRAWMAEIREHEQKVKTERAELEYCTSALSWVVENLSQSNLIKPTRPPPTQRTDFSVSN
ncbi:hypothetical protein DPEC_G00310150 [Dallia pectoralis]|uniref:Uncharacterized protein n=1 Tax=Dallia pectoralis TaxID=75939 RepID=A0ACC2FF69_DALPE|nr:hypothetical protein DPEC_G00310150 [Dallia pectoralis]